MKKKNWHAVYDMEHCIDGIECETFEKAKDCVMDIYSTWIDSWLAECENPADPTYDDRVNLNFMVCTMSAYVTEYDPDTDEYYPCWAPSDEDLAEIGWVEMEEEE